MTGDGVPIPRPLAHVSASQIKLFQRCPRAWYYQYVLGHRTPTTPALAFGTELHAAVEAYLRGGGLPEPGRRIGQLVRLAVPLLPDPASDHFEVELPLSAVKLAGVPVKGFVDLLLPGRPEVIDHKTTSNMRWAKTGPELAHDTQMLLYAWWLLEQRPEVGTVRLRHIQYTSKGRPAVGTSHIDVSRGHVATEISRIEGIVRQMLDVAALAEVESTPVDTSGCGAFGGCAHLRSCTQRDASTTDPEPAETLTAKLARVLPTREDPMPENPFLIAKAKLAADRGEAPPEQPTEPHSATRDGVVDHILLRVPLEQPAPTRSEAGPFDQRPTAAVGILPPEAAEAYAAARPEIEDTIEAEPDLRRLRDHPEAAGPSPDYYPDTATVTIEDAGARVQLTFGGGSSVRQVAAAARLLRGLLG